MTEEPFRGRGDPTLIARSRAARLLLDAMHSLDDIPRSGTANAAVGRGRTVEAQLALISAVEVLEAPVIEPANPGAGAMPETLVREALTVLGGLPVAAFTDPRVVDGCRYARRALRQVT